MGCDSAFDSDSSIDLCYLSLSRKCIGNDIYSDYFDLLLDSAGYYIFPIRVETDDIQWLMESVF